MSSDSESSSEEEISFKKTVAFKKKNVVKPTLNQNSNTSTAHDIAAAVIAKNNQIQETKTSTTGIQTEAQLVAHLDDTENPEDYNEWKLRELARLHRDRNDRINREISK